VRVAGGIARGRGPGLAAFLLDDHFTFVIGKSVVLSRIVALVGTLCMPKLRVYEDTRVS
jgi:hypothetical protein